MKTTGTKHKTKVGKTTGTMKNDARLKAVEFLNYCVKHPEQRFWQALRNWSKSSFILTSTHFEADMFDTKFIRKNKVKISDTFYEK